MSGHPTTVSAKPDTLVRVVLSRLLHAKHISPFVISTGQGGKEATSGSRAAGEDGPTVRLPQGTHIPCHSRNLENVQMTISTYDIDSQGHSFLPSCKFS